MSTTERDNPDEAREGWKLTVAVPSKPEAEGSRLRFSPITPKRAFENIAGQIRELLARGELKSGDRLPPEAELAAKFNVSRNTLREAFRALEVLGIIELRMGAGGGAYILPGSSRVVVDGLRDLYNLGAISPTQLTEARIWLDSVVTRTACERATAEEIDALEANVNEAEAAEKGGDFGRRTELHRNFHLMLAATTRNPIIIITMEAVMELLKQFVSRIGPANNPYTIPSRRRLLKHLRNRNADEAVSEMTRFLRKLHARYMELYQGPTAPSP
jgi:DNA-binding FadR family transcriptional regulator